MRNRIKIKQESATDCGAVCLASVLAHYELLQPIARIRQYACTDEKGTNVLGIVEAASKFGLTAKGVKAPFDAIYKVPKPCIAHVELPCTTQHFVVIYKATQSAITYMDPADGRMHRATLDEFKALWKGVLILLLPSQEFEPGNKSESLLAKFMRLVRPHRSIMIQSLFGSIISSLLGLSTSIYVEKIIDFVLTDGNLKLLNLLSVIMLLLLIVRFYIASVKSVFIIKTGQKIDASLILGYYRHLMHLPQQFFDTMRTGEILARIKDAQKIRILINNIFLDIIVNILIVVFTLSLMLVYSAKLSLVVIAFIPLYYLVYFLTNYINKKYLRQMMETQAELDSHYVETMNSSSTIKQFGLEEHSQLQTELKFIEVLKNVYTSTITNMLSVKATTMLGSLLTIVVLWLGAKLVIDREITIGELMSVYALVGFLIGPITFLIQSNEVLQNAIIATERLFQILDLEQEESTEKKMHLSPDLITSIELKKVTFRYGTRHDVFEELSLRINTGEMTAIVGKSGSGKSTLIKLVQNMYPIKGGAVEIGGYNIKHLSSESLRTMIAVVPQQIDLFAASIVENIAPGEPEPDMRRIVQLCEKLNMLHFIERLPEGFHTVLGEHGASLSGGERQRIAIARALYREPEILILDEATASLDSDSEEFVQRTIDYLLSQQKTIIVIAHRLSTIARAEKIIVLDAGKVIEEGKHSELLAANSAYASLWKKQSGSLM